MTLPTHISAGWPGGRALTTLNTQPGLDFDASIGQSVYSYRFELTDATSGLHIGDITPIRTATLTHDTTRTTKRSLSLELGRTDTDAINSLTDRVSPFMVIPALPNPARSDGEWPLGRYMWADNPEKVTTGGRLASPALVDEMLLVDQEIERGLNGLNLDIVTVILNVLDNLPITFEIASSRFLCTQAWGIGSRRGQILEALSVTGDFWSPWFDNLGVMQFERTFDPARAVVDIDLDVGFRVIRNTIVETDDVLTAPNRIVVISNTPGGSGDPVVGVADVPVTAPNSIPNRGFVIPKTLDLQLSDSAQAAAVAQGLVQRQNIFKTVNLATTADPRHDSYNVIRWQGENWLELGWSLPMRPGAPMTHTMRRGYS